jgi:hypothetical protein
MTAAPDPITPLPSAHDDNGILARVPSQYIAQASKSLPDPACAVDDEMSVEIDAAWAGRVRLTFRKRRYSRPRGKTSYAAWLCHRAEPVPPDVGCGAPEGSGAILTT